MDGLFLCEWCDKSFANKYSLEKHINTAKKCIESRQSCFVDCDYCGIEYNKIKMDDHLQDCAAYYKLLYNTTKTRLTKEQKKVRILEPKIGKLESKIGGLEPKMKELESGNRDLVSKNRELDSKNRALELELAENKGKLSQLSQQQVVNIDNSHKTITYSTKIKQLPVDKISPLTDEYIDSFIEEKYTFEVFYGRYSAILTWFKQLFTLSLGKSYSKDEIQEQNYACGDPTRNKFYRLTGKNPGGIWEIDLDGLIISKILDKMVDKTREYNVKFNQLSVIESENREYYRSITKDVNDVYAGITSDESRPLFVEKLKRPLKSYLSVK